MSSEVVTLIADIREEARQCDAQKLQSPFTILHRAADALAALSASVGCAFAAGRESMRTETVENLRKYHYDQAAARNFATLLSKGEL